LGKRKKIASEYFLRMNLLPITSTASISHIKRFEQQTADFLLACSVTKTCEIPGVTQAGISGFIPLTPTLDAEFLVTGAVHSLPDIVTTPSGVPTPALITRAIHQHRPFSKLGVLDLGMEFKPAIAKKHLLSFNLEPTDDITISTHFNAKEVFEKGQAFAHTYQLKGEYLIIGESVPSSTTTAEATLRALGFETDNIFASSFTQPNSIKKHIVTEALSTIPFGESGFNALGYVSDHMLLFLAGFIQTFSQKAPIVLAGGMQMATAIHIVQHLSKAYEAKNIYLITTKWLAEDLFSDIGALLAKLPQPIQAFYSSFDFSTASHPVLKLYDKGEVKEGVGAGGALGFATLNHLEPHKIITTIESFLDQ
jgi:uncharacterized protein (TIGR00303 family)